MERNAKAPDAEVWVRNGVGGAGGVPSEGKKRAPRTVNWAVGLG